MTADHKVKPGIDNHCAKINNLLFQLRSHSLRLLTVTLTESGGWEVVPNKCFSQVQTHCDGNLNIRF